MPQETKERGRMKRRELKRREGEGREREEEREAVWHVRIQENSR